MMFTNWRYLLSEAFETCALADHRQTMQLDALQRRATDENPDMVEVLTPTGAHYTLDELDPTHVEAPRTVPETPYVVWPPISL